MDGDVPESCMSRLSEFVSQATGLHFPRERWPELRRAVEAAAEELGFTRGAIECAQWLSEAPSLTKQQLDTLADRLTVGETYFFRERRHFDFLTERIIPELLQRSGERRIRVWSAGCCTGEEAYSIAIALRRKLPDLECWQVTVLATDINARFLRRAEAGVYGPWSFRDVPEWLKAPHFHARPDGQFEVLPEIKRMVRFAPLNLAEDVYPSLMNDAHAMDVIFCRNVLMYFTPAQARRVVEKMHRV
jgi:chemotaxis protein methyltransferase CheR